MNKLAVRSAVEILTERVQDRLRLHWPTIHTRETIRMVVVAAFKSTCNERVNEIRKGLRENRYGRERRLWEETLVSYLIKEVRIELGRAAGQTKTQDFKPPETYHMDFGEEYIKKAMADEINQILKRLKKGITL